MMKLKQSLKNSVKSALLFNLFISLFIYGCQCKIEPTYKEKEIPSLVKQICKKEYNLEVTTEMTPSTLWIYAPLAKILHKDFGVKEDKIFDDDMADKLRNILTTIGRVLISSDNTPEFYALVASDINIGLDYTIIGNALDIKKTYAGIIPWTESNRRYLVKFDLTKEAIGDVTGIHLKAYDITLTDFLTKQIAQRIGSNFQDEERKRYFKVEKSDGSFAHGSFIFDYSIKNTSKPNKQIDIRKEILDTIAYCIKTYEFTAFDTVEINDVPNQEKIILNKAAILARPIP